MPFPSPGDLSDPGIEPESLTSPALAGRFFTTSATWEIYVEIVNSNLDTTFSFYLQSFPASESFPRSQFFTSGGQSIGASASASASASVFPMNIQD